MALHFLAYSRVQHHDLNRNPGEICLFPGVLICNEGDWLNVEKLGRFLVKKIVWGGENNDSACLFVERG